ncbi:2-octaprenyl-6-methoxyphenol hydroxylase [Strigomonas culicis]|uniref:2-octaprenyl-6-methoxyphenol hydroxylase n=1 Tax=Strigomonas culicis TaxID=28005 RepID=S9UJB1_9TRYP|nr:2-octaprenyl-6-methoxyphenol hydroxylase [Strigomonas culicis]EPY19947.1 2-octaprenyl-6-methoxyphenol hydroxylase [Strigomonas culicis]EPY21986.1 2-octaprenyl-6-methoxyphenol hydroxylase [Strigomonas culicis]EPY28849.1 2-octaprenyl-6-methoxyphenol hydroxylase [Strigomonas culicis]|eukprot:EPY19947.1 2-octaprenyl-6-methoxyphenol hydroxylase [Strigomonas culicis]
MLRSTSACRSKAAYDVIVSGGGLVGAATMASLQQLRERTTASAASGGSALSRLMMVDVGKRPTYDPANLFHQLRTVSVTPVSSKILDNLGGWGRLTTKHSYYRIAVRHEQANSPLLPEADHTSSLFLRKWLGGKTSTEPLLEFTDLRKPVGFMCYNAELNAEMVNVVEEHAAGAKHDVLKFESKLENIVLPPKSEVDGPWGTATLRTGEAAAEGTFGLLLGCEGRGSPLRDVLHTASLQHDYAQTAFVCDVRLDKPLDGNVCCFQNFFRDGMIIALLPMSEDTANIVFSTTPQHAQRLMGASQAELVRELNQRLHDFAPADIPKIVEVPEGVVNGAPRRKQGSFPLRLNVATNPYAPRAILLGDAAHGIHPFAGQGLNLGIYDVCALTDVLEKAIRSGHDIGNTVTVGQVFAGEMLAHTTPMIVGMETIKQMIYGMPGLACAGMKAINQLPILSTLGKDAIFQVSSGVAFAARHPDCFLLD